MHNRHKRIVKNKHKMYQDLFNKDVLVVGCGNPLLGDDGFGPAVIELFETQKSLGKHVGLLDAGTSVRELLFDLLLSDKRPGTLILIDAVQDYSACAGEIICIDVDQIPGNKISDYSLHQFPTTNLLKELKDLALIDVEIYAVEISHIPQMVEPGLSRPVKAAVPRICDLIRHNLAEPENAMGSRGAFSC